MKTLDTLIQGPLLEEQANWLKTSWEKLALKLALSDATTQALFTKITTHYKEKHRAYHNLIHIYNMLQLAEQLKNEIAQYNLFQLAIWYHDIIYNALRKNNERKSAELLQKDFRHLLPAAAIEHCFQLIVSTKKHEILLEGIDNQILLDIDLAILASKAIVYQNYMKAIRKEYKIYPNILYRKGRKDVLTHFLARERIYFSDFFYEKYEAQARHNLQMEIDSL